MTIPRHLRSIIVSVSSLCSFFPMATSQPGNTTPEPTSSTSAAAHDKAEPEHKQQPQSAEVKASSVPPTSPPYPPYRATFVDPSHYDHHHHHPHPNGFDLNDPAAYAAYVYPLSPQFSVQYYSDYGNGYQSYPGSPALHPQSPPMNPTSPPFSPTFQYQQQPTASGITLSPPTHAYVPPPHSQHHHFPPIHISSPVLTGAASVPGSPPLQFIQPLPAPFSLSSDLRHKRNHSNQHSDQPIHYHTHNVYVRGLAASTTDESFQELCSVYVSAILSEDAVSVL